MGEPQNLATWHVVTAIVATLVLLGASRMAERQPQKLLIALLAVGVYVAGPLFILTNFSVRGWPSTVLDMVVALAALVVYAPLMLAGSVYLLYQGEILGGILMFLVSGVALWPWSKAFSWAREDYAAGRTYAARQPDDALETEAGGGACPFAGGVAVPSDAKVLGEHWGGTKTLYVIRDDWKVTTPGGTRVAWIDRDGNIHHGAPIGDVDPDAKLSGGATIARIQGSVCYDANGNKIGDLWK